jgi:AraC-like DNA-binding protein
MAHSAPLTIVAGLVSRAVEMGVSCGLKREELLQEVHLDPAQLEERDNRIPVETFARLWHVLAARLPDKVLALEWVRSWKITDAGVMGYLLPQLSTLGEATEVAGRYGHLVNQGSTPRLLRSEPTSRMCFVLDPVLLATQQQPEAMATSLVSFLRGVVGPEFVPLAVNLPHASSMRTPALDQFFRTPVRHGQTELSVEVPNELLSRPLPGADPMLAAYLRKQADTLLEQLGVGNAVSHETARRIAQRLGAGEPAQATIAKQMGMSERTLQRRLHAEGTTFNVLLEEARRSIAVGYLADRKLAAYEVSFLLGYSEPATFFRAFKRWTGKTPQQYRAAAAG